MEEKLGHEMLNVATGGLSAAAETTATADDDSDKKNAGRSLGDLAEAAFATEQV